MPKPTTPPERDPGEVAYLRALQTFLAIEVMLQSGRYATVDGPDLREAQTKIGDALDTLAHYAPDDMPER